MKNRLPATSLRALGTACLVAAVVSVGFSGCSVLRASEAPTTPFLLHADELKPQSDRAPWDAVWSANPGKVAVQSDTPRKIYIAPIRTEYLNRKVDDKGQWTVVVRTVDDSDVKAITDFLRTTFITTIKNAPDAHLTVVDAPAPDVFTLEMSLSDLKPTQVLVNGAADVGGLVIPGSKLVENAVAVGAQGVGGSLAAGEIAIEMKLSSGTGNLLAEAKDRETDPASILPNYRDFEQYGWTRHTIVVWAQQFVQMFSTPVSEKVDAEADISVLPW